MPTSRPRGPAPAQPPAARPSTSRRPVDIIHDLASLLLALGVTGTMYAADCPGRALLSLPRVTIWTNGHTLTWTHHGQPTTWPASDTAGAAACLARLLRPPDQPPPLPDQD